MGDVKHIIFMVQENRSLDNYFGKLGEYRASLGLPPDFDGLPANASNPGVDGNPVAAFKMRSLCTSNLSPSWNESHHDVNFSNPGAPLSAAKMDGFVRVAAGFCRNEQARGNICPDTLGMRAMGFYDNGDLPYYYFMASQFATSDRWFSPISSRTQPNRLYLLSGTSHGRVYPPDNAFPLPGGIPTIFEQLEKAGVTWKIYVSVPGQTYMNFFQPFMGQHLDKVRPLTEYFTDVSNGTLPAVAMIESKYVGQDPLNIGFPANRTMPLDEHPENHIQLGAWFVAKIINALMASPSWKESAFLLTYDEGGGLFDHVPPQPAVLPDAFDPTSDPRYRPGVDAPGTFDRTGFRVPMILVSPFSKKNFVSHTVMDYTALLRMIETRFNLSPLTARVAAQPDMWAEFFDFTAPWMTPPANIPVQPTNGPCYVDHLP